MNKIQYSEDADALLVELSNEPIDYAEESGPFIVHFSAKGEPVLLEILNAKEFVLGSLTSVLSPTTPNSVGSAVPQLYIQASTVGGGVPGFYNITSGGVAVPFTVGYQLSVPAPGAFALLGLGGLVTARRRR